MDLEAVASVVVAGLGLLGAWLQIRRRRGGLRDQIRKDAGILKLLPEDSDAYALLRKHLDESMVRLTEREDELRRDPGGMMFDGALLVISIVLGWLAFRNGGLWWWLLLPAGFLLAMGAMMLGEDATRLKRDEDGFPIHD